MLARPDSETAAPPAPQMPGDAAVQDLSRFVLPRGFRGRSAVYVQFWWIIQSLLFRTSPQICKGWRRFILRCFGAEIGPRVQVRPRVRVTYPWKVRIGAHAWVGDDVEIYSLGPISIGRNAVVSQGSYLCAGTHDHRDPTFPIRGEPIVIEDEAWVAAGCFIGPGVTIGRGAVVGARSVVLSDIPPGMMAAGHPARVLGPRIPAGR
ncbi:WcaF family extracellular polysaccharide biosynthesis acetyltransferase [Paracraurococcus ruber]|nr:WcaF family extracellular polysaccharide biosynthesis acetyltransferase [Paracraurococcus ruber]